MQSSRQNVRIRAVLGLCERMTRSTRSWRVASYGSLLTALLALFTGSEILLASLVLALVIPLCVHIVIARRLARRLTTPEVRNTLLASHLRSEELMDGWTLWGVCHCAGWVSVVSVFSGLALIWGQLPPVAWLLLSAFAVISVLLALWCQLALFAEGLGISHGALLLATAPTLTCLPLPMLFPVAPELVLFTWSVTLVFGALTLAYYSEWKMELGSPFPMVRWAVALLFCFWFHVIVGTFMAAVSA